MAGGFAKQRNRALKVNPAMATATSSPVRKSGAKKSATRRGRAAVESVVIRFAGDSGDGIQLTGDNFTQSTALVGNEFATFPDYPAEIRAPAGTTYGVSAFQINFSSHEVMTEGDEPNVLVALNPAALKVNLSDLKPGAMVIVNTGAFGERNLRKAGYEANPLDDGTLAPFRVLPLDISKMTLAAVGDLGLSQKEALRCKNLWTLGLVLWMYGRRRAETIKWLKQKFVTRPELAKANVAALNAGHAYGETAELPSGISTYTVAAPISNPASTAPSSAPRRWRWDCSRAPSSRASICSSALIRSRRVRRCSTSSRT